MNLSYLFNKHNTNDLEYRLITINDNILNIYMPSHIDPFLHPLKLPFHTETILEYKHIKSITHYRIVFPKESLMGIIEINSISNFSSRFERIKDKLYRYNDCLLLEVGDNNKIKQIVPDKYNICLSNNVIKKLNLKRLSCFINE